MFTRAFLDALTQGTSSQKARLNLRDVKDVAWDFLSSIPDAPRPVVDSPDQSEGDVAEIPFFPNPGFEKERIRLAEKEQRRRLEEQFHYAEETQRRQLEEAEKRQQLGRGGASVVPPEKETDSFDLLSPQKAQGWGKIDTFLSKRRRVAWICFMLLSLTVGSVLPGFDRGFFSISNLGMSTPYLTIIGSVGATGVGLLFLFSKDKRPFLDILGGISLCGIAFTNFALSHYISYYRAYFNYDSYYNYHYASFYIFAFFIFFVLFSLWLFVGTRFVLRSANIVGGLLLGVLLIIGGIIRNYLGPLRFTQMREEEDDRTESPAKPTTEEALVCARWTNSHECG